MLIDPHRYLGEVKTKEMTPLDVRNPAFGNQAPDMSNLDAEGGSDHIDRYQASVRIDDWGRFPPVGRS